ncbi:MAG: histidine phosphatase family protein [Rhizomicrobium sp.]
MKRLFLLRHAKAERDHPGLDDEARALAPRGREDAARIGRFLREEIYVPDLVLCSTAVRTRQTLELLLPELGMRPALQYLDELYLARPDTILSVIRQVRDGAGSLMIVGHNPGLADCAHALTREPDDRKMRRRYLTMAEKFSTGSLAILDFEIAQWHGVDAGCGDLELFVRPKDLQEE